jgi:hypothetical protein
MGLPRKAALYRKAAFCAFRIEAGESKGHLPSGGCHPLCGKHSSLLLIVYANLTNLRTEICGNVKIEFFVNFLLIF